MKFDELSKECTKEEAAVKLLEQEKMELIDRRKRCMNYLNTIKQSEVLQEFSEEIFYSLVDRVTVYNGKLKFTFKNDMIKEYELI